MKSDTNLLYVTKLSGKSLVIYFLVGIHLKCGLKFHSQTLTEQPFTSGNLLISSHTSMASGNLSMLGLKLIHVNNRGPTGNMHHFPIRYFIKRLHMFVGNCVNLIHLFCQRYNFLGEYFLIRYFNKNGSFEMYHHALCHNA